MVQGEKKEEEEKEAVILDRVCPGEGVLVLPLLFFLLMCNSLLLSQSPSVPLLQCSSFMHPPGWRSALLIG